MKVTAFMTAACAAAAFLAPMAASAATITKTSTVTSQASCKGLSGAKLRSCEAKLKLTPAKAMHSSTAKMTTTKTNSTK